MTILISCQSKSDGLIYRNEKMEVSDIKKNDTIPRFLISFSPLETIVEEVQMKNKIAIEKRNTEIQVCFLHQNCSVNNPFLKIEVVNHTKDTISLINDVLFCLNKDNNSWVKMNYPVNYSRIDMSQLIPPGKTKLFHFFFPVSDNDFKGTYELRLAMTSCNSYYSVYKRFIIK